MKLRVNPVDYIRGEINLPGDKSISHRALIFTSLAAGKSTIRGFLRSEDCLHTLEAFRALGVEIEEQGPDKLLVSGKGLRGLQKPAGVIDCGNSGTCMRLLCGLLAGQNFYSVLTGDNSLRNRPMDRVIIPLTEMGARIWAEKDKYAPLGIDGGELKGFSYRLPVASAQVKSALLLAGLYARGEVTVEEPGQSRDHTERMLQYFGKSLEISGHRISINNNRCQLVSRPVKIPGDISSATFFIGAALMLPGSEILLKNVGLNPTRSGFLDIVRKMGADITITDRQELCGEPMGDLLVKSSNLQGVEISGEIIPRLIDEIPIIAVLAAGAEGETIIRDAEELRVKETDRISALSEELSRLGVEIEEYQDGMKINGPTKFKGGVEIESYYDHRIAMSLAVAGLACRESIVIKNSECIKISFPEFAGILKQVSH